MQQQHKVFLGTAGVCVCYLHKLAWYVVVRSKQKGPSFAKKKCACFTWFFSARPSSTIFLICCGEGVWVCFEFLFLVLKRWRTRAHTHNNGEAGRFQKKGSHVWNLPTWQNTRVFDFVWIFFFAAASSLFLLWKFAQGLENGGGRGRKYELSWFFLFDQWGCVPFLRRWGMQSMVVREN